MTFTRSDAQTNQNSATWPQASQGIQRTSAQPPTNTTASNNPPTTTLINFDAKDYAGFQKSVQNRFGVCLTDYKIDQMQRRLRTLAEKHGAKSFAAYFNAMQSDSATLSAFLDTMTINVTEMLRNPDRFEELVKHILPNMLGGKTGGPLTIWSAGCSYGAEAYTLAMILRELEPSIAHKIKGTDIDLTILSKANSICFSEADVVNISPARRQANFMDMGAGLIGATSVTTARYRPTTPLRNMVQFSQHDLLAGLYPRSEYNLILCRNVLIYFTEEAKERIYRGFYQALKPGGVLFVGGTERLADHRAIGFELIRPFFYRKPVG
jgi:chemotaxis protein methyltransferase CheR